MITRPSARRRPLVGERPARAAPELPSRDIGGEARKHRSGEQDDIGGEPRFAAEHSREEGQHHQPRRGRQRAMHRRLENTGNTGVTVPTGPPTGQHGRPQVAGTIGQRERRGNPGHPEARRPRTPAGTRQETCGAHRHDSERCGQNQPRPGRPATLPRPVTLPRPSKTGTKTGQRLPDRAQPAAPGGEQRTQGTRGHPGARCPTAARVAQPTRTAEHLHSRGHLSTPTPGPTPGGSPGTAREPAGYQPQPRRHNPRRPDVGQSNPQLVPPDCPVVEPVEPIEVWVPFAADGRRTADRGGRKNHHPHPGAPRPPAEVDVERGRQLRVEPAEEMPCSGADKRARQ